MYDTFFGFSKRPFASAPQVEQYFPGTAIEDARQTLVRCVQRGEGAGMIAGSSGTGKTLLCQVLAEQFGERFRVVLLSNGRLSNRRALFQAILYELGRAYRRMDEGEARLALTGYLTNHEDCSGGMVLLVDEAHTLPLSLLDELRMLTNLGRGGEPLIRLVLAGANALEERFTNPRLDSFNQRLVARCYLEPFNRTETQDYIQSGIHAVGGDGEQIFPEPVCHSVHQVTDGVPRLINQLCDRALLSAHAAGQYQVEAACVEAAWADLQQLPVPSNSNEQDARGGSSVIEFGGLDDAPDETETPLRIEEPADEEPMNEEFATEDSSLGEFDAEEFPAEFSEELPEEFPGESIADEPVTEQPAIEATMPDEDDFQPAGTIGPEAQNVFGKSDHPFNEKFVVEEIIADRYSSVVQSPTFPQQQPSEQPSEQPPPVAMTAADTLSPDMLIVEDDYDEIPAGSPVLPVRREAYRQLFAKLRRG